MILVTENDSRQGIFLLDCHFVVCLLCHVRGWVRWGVVCVGVCVGMVGERMSPWLPVRLGGDITRGEPAG